MTCWLGLDGGWPDAATAEHEALELLGRLPAQLDDDAAAGVACTHLVDAGTATARVAVTVALPGGALAGVPVVDAGTSAVLASDDGPAASAGPPRLAQSARLALELHRANEGGRAFRYGGQAAVDGPLTVAELTSRTAIAAVVDLAGRPLPDGEVVQTFGYARPAYTQGRLALMVGPYSGGQHVPFELENPTRCCAFH